MKNLKLLVFIFFYLNTLPYLSALSIDSLKLELADAVAENTPLQLHLLRQISTFYQSVDMDSSQYYAEVLLIKAAEFESEVDMAKGYNSLANIYNLQGEYKKAIEPIDKSIALCQTLNISKGISAGLFLKANILQNLHDYTEAEAKYFESLEIAEANNDSMMIGYIFQNMGINKDFQGNYDEAIQYYFDAMQIFSSIGEELGLAQLYTNIGTIYQITDQKEKCIEYYKKAIQIKKEIGTIGDLAISYENLATVYVEYEELDKGTAAIDSAFYYSEISNSKGALPYIYFVKGDLLSKQKETKAALEMYKKGVELSKELDDPFRISIGNTSIGKSYATLGRHQKAIFYYEDVLEYAKSIENFKLEKDVLMQYIESLKQTDQHRKATEYYERVLVLNDSLFSQQTIESINEVEAKFQTEKKETENKLLKTEKAVQASTIKNQRKTLIGSVLGIGWLAMITFLIYRQSNDRKKTNKLLQGKNEKIETLHKELSHRVKNNLAFVSGLLRMQGRRLVNVEAKQAVKDGESRIEAMALLHQKLYTKEAETTIDLGEYLDQICTNLKRIYPMEGEVPKIQLQTGNIKVDGEKSVRVGLIINELVTNSFKYAFENITNPKIDITVTKVDEKYLTLTYQDNGIGLPAELAIKNSKSLGLKLVRMLTEQLKGTVQMKNKKGAFFQIDFQY
ncbi:MAG: tetratricopeptide repeat protein [Saprospiraceae bacterium]